MAAAEMGLAPLLGTRGPPLVIGGVFLEPGLIVPGLRRSGSAPKVCNGHEGVRCGQFQADDSRTSGSGPRETPQQDTGTTDG